MVGFLLTTVCSKSISRLIKPLVGLYHSSDGVARLVRRPLQTLSSRVVGLQPSDRCAIHTVVEVLWGYFVFFIVSTQSRHTARAT